MATIYEQLSAERKELQRQELIPRWFTTGGWQLFKDKYLYKTKRALHGTYMRIAEAAAKHTNDPVYFQAKFFNIMWNGWLAPSTPVLANMGTDRGMPVSCSGNYVEDSIEGFYDSYKELALLTKNGFGTSGYLGDIRPRGTPIHGGGTASGVLDVIKSSVDTMRRVTQGNARRGAWAGYLPIEHGDFLEVVEYLSHHPDDLNMGWVINQSFIDRLNEGDEDANKRFKKAMKVRATLGKGYFVFVDKMNERNPLPLPVKASNLCTEITLPSDEEHTFTCVLSSLNLAKYDEWKNTDTVELATHFLDCVASEFIELAKHRGGLEKAVRFTEKARALGLGTLGYHTYLQQKGIPFESFEAHMLNNEIFGHIWRKADKTSRQLALDYGAPKWAQAPYRRNSHLLAVAPNTSSALICGGVSQGIEPVVANIYMQSTSAGDIYRVNPVFLELAKKRGKFDDELVKSILDKKGSVQHLDWLSDHEKEVFKTAYEIDQKAIIRKAAARQPWICQGQSLNVFFEAGEDEGYIAEVHQEAFENPNILALYYMRTEAGVLASKGECTACEA